jgi:LPXTG-motif cell wall-anchored protein
VVKVVVNNNSGTSVASDFTLHVTLHGVDVAGSPAVGMGGAGRTYVLPAGNYLVREDAAAGYMGSFSGTGITNGFVSLTPGSDVTITRTNIDSLTDVVVIAPPTPAPAPAPTVAPTPKPTGTVKGGKLPKTSSPWYNLLALGTTLMLAGSLSWRLRRRRA